MSDSNGTAPTLLPQHVEDLRRSGLSDEQIAACHFRSETDPRKVGKLLRWSGPATDLVPCLVIPFPEPGGTLNGYSRIKPDKPRQGKDDGKPRKYEAPYKKANRLFFPPRTRSLLGNITVPLLITEGEKKAAKSDQEGFPCLGVTGVYNWQVKRSDKDKSADAPRKLIADFKSVALKGRPVFIVFDSDFAENSMVQWAEWHLAEALTAAGAVVQVVRLSGGPDGAKVGLDDFFVAHGPNGPDEFRKLLADAKPPEKPKDPRPEILVGPREFICVHQAIEALAKRDHDIYQRGGQLVRVTRPTRAKSYRRFSASGAPKIEPIPAPNLRTRLTQVATICMMKKKDGDLEKVEIHPPDWLAAQIMSMGTWLGIRPLEGVITTPSLLEDGSVLQRPGYHAPSGLIYLPEPDADYPPLPEQMTQALAQRARDALLEVVCDFPFVSDEHRAAWMAALLTPLARTAFDGPSPFFLIDGNIRGVGKGLLADTIAIISTGRDFARATYTDDRDEMQKVITAIALEGERLVLFDNLVGAFGNPTLDNALTAVEWQNRLLGTNNRPRLPLLASWYGTGNNIMLLADSGRRVCPIRLESHDEHPENKPAADYRHPNLLAWVREHRTRLLMAALTILSAYCRAGRPDQGLESWGSFEGWSALVRNAIVWVDLPDPALTREEFVAHSDRDVESLRGLLAGWQEIDPEGAGRTAGQVIDILKDKKRLDEFCVLREVLADLFDLSQGKLPSPQKLGYLLRRYRGRNVGGVCFDSRPAHGGRVAWRVRNIGAGRGSSGGDGWDGGDGGHVHPTVPNANKTEKGQNKETNFDLAAGVNIPTMPTIPTMSTDPGTTTEEGDA
jgi:hypothetical protein